MELEVNTTRKLGENERRTDQTARVQKLAEELKSRSGSDLPLSCFIQQARMEISVRARNNDLVDLDLPHGVGVFTSTSSDFYRSWALREL